MTFGFSAECDGCGRTEHATDVATLTDAVAEFRSHGWHIDPDTKDAPAFCPPCLTRETEWIRLDP